MQQAPCAILVGQCTLRDKGGFGVGQVRIHAAPPLAVAWPLRGPLPVCCLGLLFMGEH